MNNKDWSFYNSDGYYIGDLTLSAKTSEDALKQAEFLISEDHPKADHPDAKLFRKCFSDPAMAFPCNDR